MTAGADPGAADLQASTPIMFAAQHGYDEIVEVLLGAAADPSVVGTHGLSAIDFARQNRHRATVRLLTGEQLMHAACAGRRLVQRTLGAGEARGAMARMLRDARWGRYHALQNALYVIPGGAVLVSALLRHTRPVVAVLAILGAVGVGIAADVWRFTHYSCGQCRRRLPPPRRWWEAKQRRSPIAFECTHCDVVWVTRMSAGE